MKTRTFITPATADDTSRTKRPTLGAALHPSPIAVELRVGQSSGMAPEGPNVNSRGCNPRNENPMATTLKGTNSHRPFQGRPARFGFNPWVVTHGYSHFI